MSEESSELVVTGVRSRTHLVHIAAYLRRELSRRRGPLLVRYVGGGRFLGNARVTTEDVVRLLPQHPRLVVRFVEGPDRWAASGSGSLTYVSVGAPGLKPWMSLRRSDVRGRIHVVVTDEGLGSYGDWRSRRDSWRREGGREPWPTVRALAVHGGRAVLTGERFALYEKARGWAAQDVIANEFRRDLSGPVDEAPGRVVLLTQPWVELGLLSSSSYAGFVRQVADEVGRTGRTLQVRPHPAEDERRYDEWATITTDLPAELDRRVTGADAVVGGTSTALLNLAALHGMRALRVQVPGLEHLERELGRDQRDLLSTYLDAPTRPQELGRLLSDR